ncbi:MAG: RNA polymerase factor sigma-54 [Clostridia bacterium]|nr:RNA polymerase factor sigma-54 [Clostridia bacterium]
MEMGFGLSIHQTQKLIMTEELRLALKILQMPATELTEFIDEQIQTNPVLEQEENSTRVEGQDIVGLEYESPVDWAEYFDDQESYRDTDRRTSARETVVYENFVSMAPTLQEHLLRQLSMMKIPDLYKKICMFIIESLDENGYLQMTKHDVAKILDIDRDKVSKALKLVQSMEPYGVGARSLKECLIIQLKQKKMLTDTVKNIILEHLRDLAQNRFKVISKSMDIPVKYVQNISDEIKKLEPKPGRQFTTSGRVRYIIPDVIVQKQDDDFIIIVADYSAPRLKISKYYKDLLNQSGTSDSVSDYLNKKLNSAMWLIKCIDQRRTTLYNVVREVVDYQRQFLEKGIKFLRPLNLKDIACKLDIHESTVSRAINGKYVQTPRGIFELKYLFSSGIMTEKGNNISSESVKKIIKEIIDNEDVKKPESDQKITDKLFQQDIKISRRTVTKYREEMGIPSSNKRKRY